MPQLMPLNWMFSSMMVLIMIVSACVIYSEMKSKVKKDFINKSKNKNLWFW